LRSLKNSESRFPESKFLMFRKLGLGIFLFFTLSVSLGIQVSAQQAVSSVQSDPQNLKRFAWKPSTASPSSFSIPSRDLAGRPNESGHTDINRNRTPNTQDDDLYEEELQFMDHRAKEFGLGCTSTSQIGVTLSNSFKQDPLYIPTVVELIRFKTF